ncbi:MAG: sulfotransferase [Campylobacterota bacterium]
MHKDHLVIIAGMPRAGTTYMYKTLALHPDMYMPEIKETNYFSYNHTKGEEWFEKIYQKAQNEQKYFDVSPFYFLDPNAIERIKSFNSNQKVILLLRNPNDWIKSFYKQILTQSYSIGTFETFAKKYEIKFESSILSIDFKNFDFIVKVEQFKQAFSGNLMLIDFTHFENNKLNVLQEIEKFIGVTSFFNDGNVIQEKINAGNRKNNKFITYLSTLSILRTIAFTCLPKSFIHYIRNKYILGKPNITEELPLPDIYPQKNIFLESYFQKSGIVYC